MNVALQRSTPLIMGFAFTSFAVYMLMQSPDTAASVARQSNSGITITDQYNMKDLESSELMGEIIARSIDLSGIPAITAQLLVDEAVLVDSTATTKILDYQVRLCLPDKRTLFTTVRAHDGELPNQVKEKAVVAFSRMLALQLTARH